MLELRSPISKILNLVKEQEGARPAEAAWLSDYPSTSRVYQSTELDDRHVVLVQFSRIVQSKAK